MGCFSKSSIATRHAPVFQQPLHKQNNCSTQKATGTLNVKSNFDADAQVLRSIQNTAPTVFYSSDKLNLSPEQYKLLNKSVMARVNLFEQCDSIYSEIKTGNNLYKLGLSTKSEINQEVNGQINFATTTIADNCKKIAQSLSNIEVNKEFPLFKQSYDIMGKTCDLLSSREKLSALVNSPVAEIFFLEKNFDHMYMPKFYVNCLSVAAGDFDKEKNTADERKALLDALGRYYALQGIAEKQLPILRKNLEQAKKNPSLDKNFVSVLESSIKILEVSLKNIKNPKREAIIKQFAFPEKLANYEDKEVSKLYTYESSLLKQASDEELIEFINQLKAIPMDLA